MEPIETRSDIRHRWIPATPEAVYAACADPARIARWWGPAGFTNTIHTFDFRPGGEWKLTMHGPDGKDFPNESRFTRLEAARVFEIEHLNGHHFVLTLTFTPVDGGTRVDWRQAFDTAAHYQGLATFVAQANEQNLDRLQEEVARIGAPAPVRTPAEVVREFWRLMATNDFAAVQAVLAPGFVLEWPQSRERIRGPERFVRMNAEYPAHGRWVFTHHRLVGGESAGDGEVVTDVSVTDGVQSGRAISFFTVQGGRIVRLVEFWPEPYEPSPARAHLVERMA